MDILYNDKKTKSIVYNKHKTQKNKAPYVVFHHGLMSDMNGTKAIYIENHCKKQGYNFIRFDNFGHGNASGEFTKENISSWVEGLNMVIDNLTDGPILLVGSSMGAWVSTIVSAARKDIIGTVLISAACDFTEELIWKKITKEQQEAIKNNGVSKIAGVSDHEYTISFNLIEDGRNNLMLNKEKIDVNSPVHLIHGMNDLDVPHHISLKLAEKINSEHVVLKLIKNATHKIYTPTDLDIICNSIDEIISEYNYSVKSE